MSLYLYAMANPAGYVDPLGLFGEEGTFFGDLFYLGRAAVGLEGGDTFKDLVNFDVKPAVDCKIAEAKEFASDPMGYHANKMADAAVGLANQVAAQAENGAAAEGREAGFADYALQTVTTATGMQSLAESFAGVDMATQTELEGLDRAGRGFSGAGQGLLIATGPAAVSGTGVRAGVGVSKVPVGSYTARFVSGMRYHGKGPWKRAMASARRLERKHNDPVESVGWARSANDAEALMDEALRIRRDGGVTNKSNYNKRNSPGEKLPKNLENNQKKK